VLRVGKKCKCHFYLHNLFLLLSVSTIIKYWSLCRKYTRWHSEGLEPEGRKWHFGWIWVFFIYIKIKVSMSSIQWCQNTYLRYKAAKRRIWHILLFFFFFLNVLEHFYCVNMPYIFYLNTHSCMYACGCSVCGLRLIIQVIEVWSKFCFVSPVKFVKALDR